MAGGEGYLTHLPHVTLGGEDEFRVHHADGVWLDVEQTGAGVDEDLLPCRQLKSEWSLMTKHKCAQWMGPI